jgi:hypothetical protein
MNTDLYEYILESHFQDWYEYILERFQDLYEYSCAVFIEQCADECAAHWDRGYGCGAMQPLPAWNLSDRARSAWQPQSSKKRSPKPTLCLALT